MKIYSIEKVGRDYVVKVDEQQVMKFNSRRRAVQLVAIASELLDEVPLAPDSPRDDPGVNGGAPASITRDQQEVA